MFTGFWQWLGKRPAFLIYGKSKHEQRWRTIEVYAHPRRNMVSRWPIISGTCITWSPEVIAIGWDMAEEVLIEQMQTPACQDRPVEVAGGRLQLSEHRRKVQATTYPTASEIIAHEVGHTYQAKRLGPLYLPIGACLTWWREGKRWWNWFENQASEIGQFGGIVSQSVHPLLWEEVAD